MISQRQKTVLLNPQIGILLTEATVALHGVAPVLNAVPARSSTIRARANSLAHLVSQTRPLVGQLTATDLPSTVTAIGQLVFSLQQQGRLTTTLDNVNTLASTANRAELVRLQTRALKVAQSTLDNGRSARVIAGRTLTTPMGTLATARQILTIAEQTLAHAASLDQKVGPVP